MADTSGQHHSSNCNGMNKLQDGSYRERGWGEDWYEGILPLPSPPGAI